MGPDFHFFFESSLLSVCSYLAMNTSTSPKSQAESTSDSATPVAEDKAFATGAWASDFTPFPEAEARTVRGFDPGETREALAL